MRHSSRRILPVALALTLAVGATAPAASANTTAGGRGEGGVTVVATGLNSPRHLSFAANGDLYIAEAGAPSDSPGACAEHPEFGEVCLDDTSSITKLSKHGRQSRVVTGLPSIVSATETNGAFDVIAKGNTLTIAMGLGGTPALRDQLGEGAEPLGTVIEVATRGKRQHVEIKADLAAFEDAHDPDGAGSDSNTVDLDWDRRGQVVAVDAGGNDVLSIGRRGSLEVLAVLPPPGEAELPPFTGAPPGTMVPYQSVPTAATRGPDGAWYVAELTGFPFPVNQANIYRIGRDGTPQVYATGLTAVTDLAWSGRNLYAVQLNDEGLLSGSTGSLVKVDPDGEHVTVADDLVAPYGVAIRKGYAYVTTGSVIPGGGEVVKVRAR